MQTVFKQSLYKIIKVFYENHNTPLHLRGIARACLLNESTVFSRLKTSIFQSYKDANLKKYFIKNQYIPLIFPLFDHERLESLPALRKNAIKEYAGEYPLIVFGSTAKRNFTAESDIDLLEITEKKRSKTKAESLTGMTLQGFRIYQTNLYKERYSNVIKADLETRKRLMAILRLTERVRAYENPQFKRGAQQKNR